MDQQKIGKFISALRKEHNLTQEQLAQRLGVTDKSISRWENGRSMPDISLFEPLCDQFKITINELLSGERLTEETYSKKLEENIIINIMEIKTKVKNITKNSIRILLLIILLIILLFLLWIGITEYRNQKIMLPKEVGTARICKDHNVLRLSIETKEEMPAFVDVKRKDGKQIFQLYQLRDISLMRDTAWGGTYTIPLQLRGIELALDEVPTEIYYYSQLLWNENMEIPICET